MCSVVEELELVEGDGSACAPVVMVRDTWNREIAPTLKDARIRERQGKIDAIQNWLHINQLFEMPQAKDNANIHSLKTGFKNEK